MKHGSIFILALGLTLLLQPAAARADLREQIRSCMAQILKRVMVEPLYADYSGMRLSLTYQTANGERDVLMHLDDLLGKGFAGAVYPMKELKVGGMELPPTDQLVAKFAHSRRWKKSPQSVPSRNRSLSSEASTFRTLEGQTDKIWADPEMQGLSAFYEPGTLPVSPILAELDTSAGVILIKRKIKGMSMSDIFKKYGGDKIEDLPEGMRKSLNALFKFGQIVHRSVRVPANGKRPTLMYSPDLKPENFMWVSDPEVMKQFGLKQPGFVFVEFTHYPSEKWVYDEKTLSYPEYEKIFMSYLRFNKE